jgi:DNA-binding transcriptional MerR regulator
VAPVTLADYETTSPAARLTGYSENQLRRKADRGEITSIRTPDGRRLYLRDDLLRHKRQKQEQAR